MNTQRQHWEEVYTTKAPTEVSRYRPHLEISLGLIERLSAKRSAAMIDVGGGESTLVDDLLLRGYIDISVLDISPTAIEATRQRLGLAAEQIFLPERAPLTDSSGSTRTAGRWDCWQPSGGF
jgi:hypothetical protein